MALDKTDKKLVNGLIIAAVAVVLAYYSPWYGYGEGTRQEDEARDRLRQTATKWAPSYGQMHPAAFGTYSLELPENAEGRAYVHDLKKAYEESNTQSKLEIQTKQAGSRMNFPDWTDIPEDQKRDPGIFFANTFLHRRLNLESEWQVATVECLDPDIGFSKWVKQGNVGNLDMDKSKEYLRELYIAEMIIRMCIKAKQDEKADEEGRALVSEAFMRIINVTPSESVPTAPTALTPNLTYDPNEKNPLSPRFRKYNVKSWRKFIQEYNVEILLQCDMNSFMRFLYSVRTAGQFLVIRNLEIVSPFMDDSRGDKAELARFKPAENALDAARWPPKDEHILVRMSAAGMDFFDPDKFPDGIYNPAKKESPSGGVRRRRMGTPTKGD